jgi:hypothetical protein
LASRVPTLRCLENAFARIAGLGGAAKKGLTAVKRFAYLCKCGASAKSFPRPPRSIAILIAFVAYFSHSY